MRLCGKTATKPTRNNQLEPPLAHLYTTLRRTLPPVFTPQHLLVAVHCDEIQIFHRSNFKIDLFKNASIDLFKIGALIEGENLFQELQTELRARLWLLRYSNLRLVMVINTYAATFKSKAWCAFIRIAQIYLPFNRFRQTELDWYVKGCFPMYYA